MSCNKAKLWPIKIHIHDARGDVSGNQSITTEKTQSCPVWDNQESSHGGRE